MGDIEPEAAELSEEQCAERQRAGKVHPEIDIHYKSNARCHLLPIYLNESSLCLHWGW